MFFTSKILTLPNSCLYIIIWKYINYHIKYYEISGKVFWDLDPDPDRNLYDLDPDEARICIKSIINFLFLYLPKILAIRLYKFRLEESVCSALKHIFTADGWSMAVKFMWEYSADFFLHLYLRRTSYIYIIKEYIPNLIQLLGQ